MRQFRSDSSGACSAYAPCRRHPRETARGPFDAALDRLERALVRGQLRVARGDHRNVNARRARPDCRRHGALRRAGVEAERGLAAAHREVHVREDARIEQRAVQVAAGIVHAVALAERVEVVALARVHAPRQRERVEHAADGPAIVVPVPARASSLSRKPTSNGALWITSSAPSTNARNSAATSAKRGCDARNSFVMP